MAEFNIHTKDSCNFTPGSFGLYPCRKDEGCRKIFLIFWKYTTWCTEQMFHVEFGNMGAEGNIRHSNDDYV